MNSVIPTKADKRILIVDDDDDFSAAIAEILDSEGYTFRRAHSAQEACAEATTFDAHVALIDIRLGRDNGIELIEKLKAAQGDILCVMMTGHAALDTAIQALQYGAYNYLRKPIDGLDLLSTLERCFEKILLEEDKRCAETALEERNAELVTLSVRLRGIVESAQRLAGAQGVAGFIPLLHKEVKAVAGAEFAALYLRHNSSFERVCHDPSFDLPEVVTVAALRQSSLYNVVDAKCPVLIRDSNADGVALPEAWENCCQGSILVVPFCGDGGATAGLAVLCRDKSSPFLSQDRDLGLLLSSVCSEILRGALAAEALLKSEQRYRLLADNVADVIWTVDLDGRITYMSPSMENMCGFRPEELEGHPLDKRLTEESATIVRALLTEAHAAAHAGSTEDATNVELDLRRKDGGSVLTETRCIVLREDGDTPTGLLAVSRDISERKQAEEARSRLAAAVEHAAESIIITDPEGIIQYVNPAFETLLGYSREESLGKTPWILRQGKMDDEEYQKLWVTLTAGKVWQGRFSNSTKTGQRLEQEATISAIRDARGAIINYVCVARDVTHEVELEAQLRQAQKMEAIGTLAGGIAHDFNNMLSPILGYAELALMSAGNGSPLSHYLQEIHSAGKRASELVRQILAFSRRSEQEQRPVAMDEIVHECMQLIRGSLPSTISIQVQLDSCPPVMADPTQMHQVIMNLCTNAYHAMRDSGGVLAVGLQPLAVTPALPYHGAELTPGEYVRLTVSDTGQGMDEDTLERVFEPYFTTKRVGEGTGLGLATVHGIIKAHHGHVIVSSAPNAGTTFEVCLPAAEIFEASPAAPDPENKEGSQERILVVDDEPAIVTLLSRGLEMLGYRVEGFTDSLEALEAFRADPAAFDMVLTDQTMPKMTGIELARRVLELRPEIPIVLATGYSDSVNETIARRAGVRDFLFKPVSPRAIASRIHEILHEPAS